MHAIIFLLRRFKNKPSNKMFPKQQYPEMKGQDPESEIV